MRIAILEDTAEDAALLLGLLERYAKAQQLAVEISAYTGAEDLLQAFAQGPFDIAFLDIYLQDSRPTGMDVAKGLRDQYPACKLVFATSSHAHAVAGYSTKAAAYLIKPVEYEALSQAMDLCEVQSFRDRLYMQFYSGGVPFSILLCELLFADCADRRVNLHLATETLAVDGLMGNVAAQLLAHDRFLLCNRDLVVNMDWIVSAEIDSFCLKNGQLVPIRNRGRREVKQAYVAYRMGRFPKGGIL